MRTLLASLLVLLVAVPAAAARSYSAERFDSHARVLPGGAMEVTETAVFKFEGGPFERVFRELPSNHTDGIEIVEAQMDGRTLPFGSNLGQVEVRSGSKINVRWRFAPRADSSHVFVLRYVMRGIVKRDSGADVLEWLALPVEHAYRIDSSEVVIDIPSRLTINPSLDSARVGEKSL